MHRPNARPSRGRGRVSRSAARASAVAGVATPSLQFGLTDSASGFIGFLQALRQESLAKTLANPVLVTTSGRVAEFLVGGKLVLGAQSWGAPGDGEVFLVEALATTGGLDAFRASLKPGNDAMLKARVAEVVR